ncbi:MAG: TraR/DksA family transcriptional regulator [Opitutae bacterium]|nr:TraR/DksA family transcriptional regulator [Opitutae bacterium]
MKPSSVNPPSEGAPWVFTPKPAAARGGRWAWHYRALTDLRDALLRDREEKLSETAGLTIEPHSVHPADSATDEFDHELSLALLAAEQNGLNEVNDAILRILSGRYGVCEESGRPIPAARLRAVPWTRYTAEVERQREKSGELPRAHLEAAVSLRGSAPPAAEAKANLTDEGDEPAEPRVPEVLEFDPGAEEEAEPVDAEMKPKFAARPHRASAGPRKRPGSRKAGHPTGKTS